MAQRLATAVIQLSMMLSVAPSAMPCFQMALFKSAVGLPRGWPLTQGYAVRCRGAHEDSAAGPATVAAPALYWRVTTAGHAERIVAAAVATAAAGGGWVSFEDAAGMLCGGDLLADDEVAAAVCRVRYVEGDVVTHPNAGPARCSRGSVWVRSGSRAGLERARDGATARLQVHAGARGQPRKARAQHCSDARGGLRE